jgi:hypothetical protein
MLLGHHDMTIAGLREQGVTSPAQSLYDLQIVGYRIERMRVTSGDEGPSVVYRLGSGREI